MFEFWRDPDYSSRTTDHRGIIAKGYFRLPFQNVNNLVLNIVRMGLRFSTRLNRAQEHFEGIAKLFTRKPYIDRTTMTWWCVLIEIVLLDYQF